MSQTEGVMTRQDANNLRDFLYPNAETLFGFPVVEHGRTEAAKPKAAPKSEHVLTLRKIPLIGSEETVDVWIKG